MEATQFETDEVINILFLSIVSVMTMSLVLFLFFRFARNKIAEKELEKAVIKIEGHKRILQASIETQERERKRIAQDLHDAISAKLNVVSLHVNMLLDGGLTLNEQQDALGNVLGVTTKVLDSSRQIAHNLLPPILDSFGLVAALEEVLEEFSATKKVDVQYEIAYLDSLSENDELHLFRVVQELLNNSIRHGKATKVKFNVQDNKESMEIVYTDNGKGFLVKEALLENGLGLKNIKSRISILNGVLNIKSNISKGAVFTINIKHNRYE